MPLRRDLGNLNDSKELPSCPSPQYPVKSLRPALLAVSRRWRNPGTPAALLRLRGQASGEVETIDDKVGGVAVPIGSLSRLSRDHPKRSSHSHFFTQAGQFGSLDQNLNQVDNGHYTIINGHTFKIGDATFHYTITGGDTLSLDPVITPAERKKALANPDEFTTASWMMAVAYPGTTWKRVPCEGWC